MKLKREYVNYRQWEDFKNGLYSNEQPIKKNINLCKELLSNNKDTYYAMKLVVQNWPLSTKHNLTNYEINRRAWLGQACCCLRFSCNSETVILAWRELTLDLQEVANCMADTVIKEYEETINRKLCPKLNLE